MNVPTHTVYLSSEETRPRSNSNLETMATAIKMATLPVNPLLTRAMTPNVSSTESIGGYHSTGSISSTVSPAVSPVVSHSKQLSAPVGECPHFLPTFRYLEQPKIPIYRIPLL